MGRHAGPLEQAIDSRWLMAYSAALGETDARFYDTTAPQGVLAHPVFPVCYEWPLAQPLRNLPGLQPYYPRLLHAQHDLTLHRPLRAGDSLRLSARIVSVAPRRPGALVVFGFEARDAAGALVTTTEFGALYRGVQAAAAGEPARDPPTHSAALAPAGQIAVAENAAHVYTECARIWNPIHTDIAYARAAGLPGLILHGTATLALSVSRALAALQADAAAVRRVRCRFAGMVLMPSTLFVHAAREGRTIAFETRNARGESVISHGTLALGEP